jgi:hypothetical protein
VKDPINIGWYFERLISRDIDLFDDEALVWLQM